MEKPLVSIITVAYNSGKFIRDTIESVLAQTYTNIEYIIGDDRSGDNTWDIIQEYTHDKRIIAYKNEVNLREYPNRNKAIELANGKYLMFIDGDDVIFPHGIGFFVSMMEAFPQVGMAVQKNYYNNILYPALFEPEETLRNYFYGSAHLLASSFASNFFRADVIKKWKLRTDYITGDEEIRLKIAATYPVLFVAGWVTWPRETPDQASAKMKDGTTFVEGFLFANEILSTDIPKQIDAKLIEDLQSVLKKTMAQYIGSLLRKAKIGEARYCLKKTGLRWNDVISYYNYQPRFNDVLSGYTPVTPFKKGFLNKVK